MRTYTQEEINRSRWIGPANCLWARFFEDFCNGRYDDAPWMIPVGDLEDRICMVWLGDRNNYEHAFVNPKYSIQDIYKATMHQFVWIKYVLRDPKVQTMEQVWNVLEHHNVSDIDQYDEETWTYVHEAILEESFQRCEMKDISDLPPINFTLDKGIYRGNCGARLPKTIIPQQMEYYNIGMIKIKGELYQEVKIKGRRAIRKCEGFTIEEFLDLSTITKEDYEFAKTVDKLQIILNDGPKEITDEVDIESIIKDYQSRNNDYAPLLAPEIIEKIRETFPSHIPISSRELCMEWFREMALESWGYCSEPHNISGPPTPPRAGP